MFGLKRLYAWTLTLASRPWALWALIVVAFAESAFFPIPPDVLLVPLVLGRLALQQAVDTLGGVFPLACTMASVAGGVLGYAIGALLMDSVGGPILSIFHYEAKFDNLRSLYNEQGLMIVLLAGLTPILYKVFTIFEWRSWHVASRLYRSQCCCTRFDGSLRWQYCCECLATPSKHLSTAISRGSPSRPASFLSGALCSFVCFRNGF